MIDPTSALYKELRAELALDEGLRPDIYDDSTSRKPILAVWHNGRLVLSAGKLTFGIGHNISDQPLTPDQINAFFVADLNIAHDGARQLFPALDSLSQSKQAALIGLVFNMGLTTLSAFHQFVPAVNAGRWADAANDLIASQWFHEVQPERRERVIAQIKNG